MDVPPEIWDATNVVINLITRAVTRFRCLIARTIFIGQKPKALSSGVACRRIVAPASALMLRTRCSTVCCRREMSFRMRLGRCHLVPARLLSAELMPRPDPKPHYRSVDPPLR